MQSSLKVTTAEIFHRVYGYPPCDRTGKNQYWPFDSKEQFEASKIYKKYNW